MIRRQITLPTSADRVWTALTDPAEAESWFGGRIAWDLTPDGPLHFDDEDGSTRDGRIDTVRPGQYLRYRWWPSDEPESTTEVSYLLEPDGDGTRLTIQERSAGSAVASAAWSPWDTRIAGAWTALASLQSARA